MRTRQPLHTAFLLFFLFFGIVFQAQSQAKFKWTGMVSTEWTEPGNWNLYQGTSLLGYPGPNDFARLEGTHPNIPVLTGPITVGTLQLKSGQLDMNGNTMTGTNGLRFQGGTVLGNGSFVTPDFIRLNSTTFTGNVIFEKTGNLAIAGRGGNTFQGTVTYLNNGTGYWRVADTNGDTYQGPATFTANAGGFDIAYGGGSTFEQDLIINNPSASPVRVGYKFSPGMGGGMPPPAATEVTIDGLLQINSFPGNTLRLYKVVQNGTGVNTTVADCQPKLLLIEEGSYAADWGAAIDSALLIVDAELLGNNLFLAPDIPKLEGSVFSTTPGSSTSIEKTAAAIGGDTWNGGNTFGDVTIINSSDGFLLMGQNDPDTYQGDADFQRLGTGQLEPCFNGDNTLAGDLSVTGKVVFGYTGNGRLLFVGDTDQEVNSTPAGIPLIRRMVVDKLGGDITLNGPVDVDRELTLNSGKINTTSANILRVFSDLATVDIGNASSFVNGPMINRQKDNLPITLVFPVGRDFDWRPCEIDVQQEAKIGNDYKVEVINSSAQVLQPILPVIPGEEFIENVSQVRYWTIESEEAVNLLSKGVTLYYGDNDGVSDPDFLRMVRDGGPGVGWLNLGGAGTSFPSGSIANAVDFPNEFGVFTLGNAEGGLNVLPVELLYFEAQPDGDKVMLQWATASETDHAAFEVERSVDGKTFTALKKIQGDGQNRHEEKVYREYDYHPLPGISYYRLKQIDLDGTVTYFDIRSVSFDSLKPEGGLTVFPVPARDFVRVQSEGKLENATVFLFNAAGQQVPLQYTAEEFQLNLRVGELPVGLYTLRVITADQQMIQQIAVGQ